MSESKLTQNHSTIKKWAEARGGVPAMVSRSGNGTTGILRIDFPGGAGSDQLKKVSWEDFFEEFDQKGLQFLYQEETKEGDQSRFCKFVYEPTKNKD